MKKTLTEKCTKDMATVRCADYEQIYRQYVMKPIGVFE
jgi:hypothetical protein